MPLEKATCHFSMALSIKALLNTTRRFETCVPASSNGFIQSPWYTAAPGQAHGPVWGKCEIMEANDYHSRMVESVTGLLRNGNIAAALYPWLFKRGLSAEWLVACAAFVTERTLLLALAEAKREKL